MRGAAGDDDAPGGIEQKARELEGLVLPFLVEVDAVGIVDLGDAAVAVAGDIDPAGNVPLVVATAVGLPRDPDDVVGAAAIAGDAAGDGHGRVLGGGVGALHFIGADSAEVDVGIAGAVFLVPGDPHTTVARRDGRPTAIALLAVDQSAGTGTLAQAQGPRLNLEAFVLQAFPHDPQAP